MNKGSLLFYNQQRDTLNMWRYMRLVAGDKGKLLYLSE